MKLSFTATSTKELHEKIASYCKEAGISENRQASLPLSQPSSAPAAVPVLSGVAEETTKRTRRTKAQIEADEAAAKGGAQPAVSAATDFLNPPSAPPVAQVQAPTAPAAAAAVNPAIIPTPAQKQAVIDAMTNVNGKFGLPFARALLSKFGTDRLSALPVEKYTDFLALCEKVKVCATLPEAQVLLA